MKKLILILFLLIPYLAMAECPDPTGTTYQGDGIVLRFATGYGDDRILQLYTNRGDYYIHYDWNGELCRATLALDPVMYLDFDDSWIDLSTMLRFQVVGTVE